MKLLYCALFATFVLAVAGMVKTSTTSQGQKKKQNDNDVKKQFDNWKSSNGKSYSNQNDEKKAKSNFVKNSQKIESHNQKKNATFKRETNEDSDMTYEQKTKQRMGCNKAFRQNSPGITRMAQTRSATSKPLPSTVDYRSEFTPVKNQGLCGACWAFSTTAILEYRLLKDKNISLQLSEQEMLDCNTNEMNCPDGGWPTTIYNYVLKKGLTSNEAYEYVAYTDECLNTRLPRISTIKEACEFHLEGDENAMKEIIARFGPVSVTLWVTEAFTSYKSGVYYEEDCPTGRLNHAVAIVGYGTDEQYGDFWWIRNSWGEKWGYNGYAKFARNRNNTCGICEYAMFPCGIF